MENQIEKPIYNTALAIPEASSMIETFRAIGYTIEAAIADIIDNSISANAKNIWLNFEWIGEDSWITIKDDGSGMNSEELVKAMTPGSKNPLSGRNLKDLGRFGLGLKTASFSQARILTVLSKKPGYNSVYWTWDLNHVMRTKRWELIQYLPDNNVEKELSELNSGTIVIWNNLDRIVKNINKDDQKSELKFYRIMDQVKHHLAMVFHKYIEQKKINIFFQNRTVTAWNPYLIDEQATQHFPIENINDGKVKMQGFVLPHKSKLDEATFKLGEGSKGWNDHQGFYIYRNDRLLLSGNWLGLFRKEEHYKLARIQIELPNTLDEEWQIDIKKSDARPPLLVKDQIKAYALGVRKQAVEVYRHKGKNINPIVGQTFVPLWLENKRGDKWFHKINRENPTIEKIKQQSKTEPEKAIESLLKIIEETLPTKSIFIKESEEPELQGRPFEGSDSQNIKSLMQAMYTSLISDGKTDQQAKATISYIEPFNHFTHFLEFLN